MTYRVTYTLHAYTGEGFARGLYEKRGAFIVEGDTCEQATERAKVVLDDAVGYGKKHLGVPENVCLRITAVLPTEPPAPTLEAVVEGLAKESQ